MIPNSFHDELLKQAAPVGFLASLGKVLEKHVPSALTSIRGAMSSAGLADVAKAKLVGGAVGAAGGALAGRKMSSEENKGRGTVVGAALGAAAGAFGGAKLAPKVPTFGTAAGPALKGLGVDLQKGKVTGKNLADYLATKWAPRAEKLTSSPFTQGDVTRFGAQPTAKIGPPGFKQTKSPLAEITNPTGSKLLGHVGELAENAAVIQHGIQGNKGILGKLKGGASGVGSVLAGDVRESKLTTKGVEGKNYLFERTGLGKIVSPALQSGVGMGAASFAMGGKDEEGNKKPIGKRLLSSGGTALAWGTAPKIMMGKMLAYDMPKSLIGLKKPKLQNEQQVLS